MSESDAAQRLVDDAFRRVLGKPCWGVENTFGSFLVLNFGRPRLRVYAPRRDPRTQRVRRLVVVAGKDHLWIQQAVWSLERDGVVVATSRSAAATIESALRMELAGQALTRVQVRGGCADFAFDLGTVLATRPHTSHQEPDADGGWPRMFQLFSQPNRVLTLFGDGTIDAGRADQP